MRAIWKGAVSFGLVSVPVKLYAATESHDVSFRQVHAKDGGRIKYQRVCSIDGEEVAYADIAKGYETEVGERGVTLSGGQRQRLALARAFLSDPRILILDDSTSAIDSATEDEIQKAIRRAQEGRTTLLITHRLSQIRWADHTLVLEDGKIIASGTHEELLRTSPQYRRIFARYDAALPPLQEAQNTPLSAS